MEVRLHLGLVNLNSSKKEALGESLGLVAFEARVVKFDFEGILENLTNDAVVGVNAVADEMVIVVWVVQADLVDLFEWVELKLVEVNLSNRVVE